MIVRRVQSIRTIPDLIDEGEIFVEYGDKTVTPTIGKGLFYSEDNKNPSGTGLPIDDLSQRHGGFDKYFKELDPIKLKDTAWGKIVEPRLRAELKTAEDTLKIWQDRVDEIKSIISSIEVKKPST